VTDVNYIDKLRKLQALLEEWAKWMRRDDGDLGYPRASAGFASGGISCWDDLVESIDSQKVLSIDAAIDSLPPVQACAIHHCYLTSVYRFGRMSYAEALDRAHDGLLVILPARGVVV